MTGNCLYCSLLYKLRNKDSHIKIEYIISELYKRKWSLKMYCELFFAHPIILLHIIFPHFYIEHHNKKINWTIKKSILSYLWYDVKVERTYKNLEL